MNDVWFTRLFGGESMSPSCRPHSSIIATTSILELPPTCVAKAAALLRDQPDNLESYLSQPCCARALWRQGLEKAEVLAAAAGVDPANTPGKSPRKRYALQLLGQIVWETELGASNSPNQIDPWGDRAMPRHIDRNPCAEASLSPEAGAADGSCRQKSRARAQSARVRKNEVPEDIGDLRRWETKLSFALYIKEQHHKEVQERARSRNGRIEAVRASYAQRKQEHEDRQQSHWQQRTKDHEERVARSKGAKQEISDLMVNASAVRQAVLQTNRRKIFQEQETLRSQRIEQESKRQLEAEQKRRKLLQEKGVGRAKLRETREISCKQATRLERIRNVERELLRQKIEFKSPSATPSVSPRARSRPSSARGSQPFVPHPPCSKAPAARRPFVQGYKADGRSNDTLSAWDWEPLVGNIPEPSLMPWPRCADALAQGDQTERTRPSSAEDVASSRTTSVPKKPPIENPDDKSGEYLGAEGIFPVSGFRTVTSDDVLQKDLATAAALFDDLLADVDAKTSPELAKVPSTVECAADESAPASASLPEEADPDPRRDKSRISHAVRVFVYGKLAHDASKWELLVPACEPQDEIFPTAAADGQHDQIVDSGILEDNEAVRLWNSMKNCRTRWAFLRQTALRKCARRGSHQGARRAATVRPLRASGLESVGRFRYPAMPNS
ncbi:hypothetical protein AK812_SmicGene15216 [Symbiodinium microadriaticum]|uniref:Uncharacterized protein n=1 Tax=Symbiodinium microadriaticum TaxID=2951 RepID=A0A1Q9E3H5_SYMMI|nr:hypothetical protein AK812_SmicGene15216 [Symbiodinium microadriaticum]